MNRNYIHRSIASYLECSLSDWDQFLLNKPEAHLLQQAPWGELKANFGWEPLWVNNSHAGAQILFKPLPLGYSFAYIPKGPVGDNWASLMPEIDAICKARKAVFLKIEQDNWLENEIDLKTSGFLLSKHAIQPRRSITLDISGSEDDILQQMKQKTRYNIRLAAKKGVEIIESEDINAFSRMMDITGLRDTFGVHSKDYYRKAFQLFQSAKKCVLLIAQFKETDLAGVMVFSSGSRAWYLYGASNNQHRNLMPTYLLQWEAIRWAKAQGCTEYDLWGVPDANEEDLENQFQSRSDGLWGVYRFKRGFGGQLKQAAHTYDRVYNYPLYWIYKLLFRKS